MTKKRAYTSPTGKDSISAEQVKAFRAGYNYRSYPYPLYSTDAPGHRKRVYHSRKGSGFFAFTPDGSGGSAASGGETLNHLLFKEAIAGLKRTRLSLYKPGKNKAPDFWIDVPITLCSPGDLEKMIAKGDGSHPLFADVYFKFESDHWLAQKWSGEAYLEVFNTHAVGVEKQKVLKRLELPTIEVDIREPPYAYPVDEEDTTDEQEAAHVRRLRHMLEHNNGFLKATVLSNPSSAPYLKKRLIQQIEQTNQVKAELDVARSTSRSATIDKLRAEEALNGMEADRSTLQTAHDELADRLEKSRADLDRLTQTHKSLVEDHQVSAETHDRARWSLHLRYLVALLFVVAIFAGLTFLWPADEPVQVVAETAAPQSVEPPQPVTDRHRPRAKAHAGHGSSGR